MTGHVHYLWWRFNEKLHSLLRKDLTGYIQVKSVKVVEITVFWRTLCPSQSLDIWPGHKRLLKMKFFNSLFIIRSKFLKDKQKRKK